MFKVGIIIASDKASIGERQDLSGQVIEDLVKKAGYKVVAKQIVPDEKACLKELMCHMADEKEVALLLTTGGTGFSKRDVTPEATLEIIQRQAPGIAEAMRYHSMKITPRAMLSRGVAGIRGNTLIINLPGSPKAVRENLSYILPTLTHGLEILHAKTSECGREIGKA